MARGWESKSIEAQIEEASGEAVLRRTAFPEAEARKRTDLLLQRSRILQEIASARNPRYRNLLEQMLNHLETELNTLAGLSIVNRQS